MATTYNGRFKLPKKPDGGGGWLLGGIAATAWTLSGGGVFSVVLAIGCFIAYRNCQSDVKLYRLFQDFCTVIGMRNQISVRELAKTGGIGADKVRRSLQRMLSKGFFGAEAHLDGDADMLFLVPATQQNRGGWKDIVFELLDALRGDKSVRDAQYTYDRPASEPEKPKAEPVKPRYEQPETAKSEPARSKPVNASGKNYMDELERTLNELYRLNGQIEDEGVSRRIDRIGELTGGIFRAVIEKPERENEVRKFMNYYLPTTLKLLKSYDMLEDQSYQGENIVSSRKKIESVLDMLIEAYERQLDRLFSDAALDIATDIDVLETMLSGDGLSAKGRMEF